MQLDDVLAYWFVDRLDDLLEKRMAFWFRAAATSSKSVAGASTHPHHDIVNRFGRYPHSNQLVGRESTADQPAFLREIDPLNRA